MGSSGELKRDICGAGAPNDAPRAGAYPFRRRSTWNLINAATPQSDASLALNICAVHWIDSEIIDGAFCIHSLGEAGQTP